MNEHEALLARDRRAREILNILRTTRITSPIPLDNLVAVEQLINTPITLIYNYPLESEPTVETSATTGVSLAELSGEEIDSMVESILEETEEEETPAVITPSEEEDLLTEQLASVTEQFHGESEESPVENTVEDIFSQDQITEWWGGVVSREVSEGNPNPVNEVVENTEAAAEPQPVIIPPNSPSILVDEATSRFSSAIWYSKIQEKKVILAGLGGIGSYVAFLLARVHPQQIVLLDPDVVETVNMSGQLYGLDHVGSTKTKSTISIMQRFANYHDVVGFSEAFTENTSAGNIMICGFDSMTARKTYFWKWYQLVLSKDADVRKHMLFIDGRLAAEEFQVFCLRGDDQYSIVKYMEEFLFSDEEAEATLCSYKQTTFMANMIGSVMVNLFVNFVANECNPVIDRDLPFYTEYNAQTMFFNTTH